MIGEDVRRPLPLLCRPRIPDRLDRAAVLQFARSPSRLAFEAVTAEQWREVVATNLDGAFHCTQAAYRVMREQVPPGGRVINNGSVSAHVPPPGAVACTATKHAVTGLTRAIALEGRAHGIACGKIDVGNRPGARGQRAHADRYGHQNVDRAEGSRLVACDASGDDRFPVPARL